MATFLAHITVRSGGEAEFEAASAELARATLEREPGCHRYEYWRGEAERTYYVLASFTDARAFLVHQMSDHHTSFGSERLMTTVEAFRLEWIEPVEGLAPFPPTVQLPLRDGADAVEADFHRRFPVAEPAWWRTRSGAAQGAAGRAG